MTREEFMADLVLHFCKDIGSTNLSKETLDQIEALATFIYGA